jgi:hypothetical protein
MTTVGKEKDLQKSARQKNQVKFVLDEMKCGGGGAGSDLKGKRE